MLNSDAIDLYDCRQYHGAPRSITRRMVASESEFDQTWIRERLISEFDQCVWSAWSEGKLDQNDRAMSGSVQYGALSGRLNAVFLFCFKSGVLLFKKSSFPTSGKHHYHLLILFIVRSISQAGCAAWQQPVRLRITFTGWYSVFVNLSWNIAANGRLGFFELWRFPSWTVRSCISLHLNICTNHVICMTPRV